MKLKNYLIAQDLPSHYYQKAKYRIENSFLQFYLTGDDHQRGKSNQTVEKFSGTVIVSDFQSKSCENVIDNAIQEEHVQILNLPQPQCEKNK